MSRISGVFAQRRAAGQKVLIPYLTAGDPSPETTLPLMHAMVKAGADIIELGIPFSDPMAEGPVIQRAMERALEHHMSLHQVLDIVTAFRQTDHDTPVVLMGYLNPVEVMGYENYAQAAARAGVDATLIVDMPPEEADDFVAALSAQHIDRIFLVSPTTNDTRIRNITRCSSGFVYYVSLKGVTGAGNLDTEAVKQRVDVIKSMTDIPVGVGFGIKDAATARLISRVADAVVVGSALVQRVEENPGLEQAKQAVSQLIGEIRVAIDE